MKIFGFDIEKISEKEAKELEVALEVLERHGFRAVRKTTDKSKKVASAAKASEAKEQQTKKKIQNGYNLWRLEGDTGKKLTAYKLGQLAGVSQNTAKKYLAKIDAL